MRIYAFFLSLCLVAGATTDVFAFGIQRVWAIDDGERIGKLQLNHPLANSTNNKVWVGNSVHLFGARNEVVAFQLIIQGNVTGATNVNVTLESLQKTSSPQFTITNTGGTGNPYNYVGKRIEMFVQHYMKVTDRTNAAYLWWSSCRPLPDTYFLGLLPEILVPFEAPAGNRSHGQGGAPFRVTALQNQGVWVDIYVPRNAEPGDYTGTMKVTENSTVRYSIPVNLKVYGFALPDSSHVRNAFIFNEEALLNRHALTSNTASYWNMVRKYYAMLYRHRANGQHIADTSAFKAQLARVYDGSYFTPANGYAGPGEGIGPNYYAIGGFDQPNRVPGATISTDRGWSQFSGGNYYAMRGRGEWASGRSYSVNDVVHDNEYPFWYWCKVGHTSGSGNEPQESGGGTNAWKKYWLRFYDRGDRCGFAFNPDTTVMKQNWWRAADWWVNWFQNNNPSAWIMKYGPEEPNIEDGINDTSAFADVRRKVRWLRTNPSGKILDFRTATTFDREQWPVNRLLDVVYNGPSQTEYGGVILDSVNAALARGQRVGLYGGTRPHWGTDAIDAPPADIRMKPWAMWKYRFTEYSYWMIGNFGNRNHWDRDRNAYGDTRKYGDGTLVYPGEDDLFPGDSRGLDGPVAGIRLKSWRRGAQDYEYLHLARRAGINVDSLVNKLVPAAFDEVPNTSQARFSQRGYQYELVRKTLAHLIGSDTTSNTFQMEVQVHEGWNHVSVPLTPNSLLATDVFPNAVSPAFQFHPLLGFLPASTLVNGVGYRVKFDVPATIVMTGEERLRDTVAVTTGWNLIGSISFPVPTALIQEVPPGIVMSDYFEDESGTSNMDSYTVADTLWPSRAYWVKVSSSGTLILDPEENSAETP